MGESYDGRAAVPSISREGVTQKSCRVTATQSIIKDTEQSACFGRGGVTAFTERRVTGVLAAPPVLSSQIHSFLLDSLIRPYNPLLAAPVYDMPNRNYSVAILRLVLVRNVPRATYIIPQSAARLRSNV